MGKHSVKACLIVNPRSGGGNIDLTEALKVFGAQGWQIEIKEKLHKGYAVDLARQAAERRFDVVIACGGDGTVSEVVDGLVGTDVAMGTLPTGTENVWSKEIGISSRLRVAAMQLVGADRIRVDVGRVVIDGHHQQHFLLMAGLGLDGAVMARVSRSLKNRIGPAAVGVAAVSSIPRFRSFPVRAEVEGVEWRGTVTQIVVGNTRRYGGFTQVTGEAYIDDGLLDLCLITAHGPAAAMRQAASLIFRQRPSGFSSESYRASQVTIYAPQIIPLQLDGGAIDQHHLHTKSEEISYTFSCVSHGATVLVPKTYDGTLLQSSVLRDAERSTDAKKQRGKGKEKKDKSKKKH